MTISDAQEERIEDAGNPGAAYASLLAERDRYHKALDQIAGFDGDIAHIARAALRETEPEETNDLPGGATEPGPDWRQA